MRFDASSRAPIRAHAEPATSDVAPMQNCRNATRLSISFIQEIANLTRNLLALVPNFSQLKSLSIWVKRSLAVANTSFAATDSAETTSPAH